MALTVPPSKTTAKARLDASGILRLHKVIISLRRALPRVVGSDAIAPCLAIHGGPFAQNEPARAMECSLPSP